MNCAELFEVYKQNMDESLTQRLVSDLGRSTASLGVLGVGFRPRTQSWIFAERDATGNVIGLSSRSISDGKKFMVEGSKRGLIYPYNQDHLEGNKKYEAGRFHWVRIGDIGIDCPICAKPDWCRVSSDYNEAKGPSAVACNRIKEGSIRELSPDGQLHIIDEERQKIGSKGTVLVETELPIIIVEGASDVLAAMDLGFVAIGRPSAEGGMEILKEMPLAGREVWIIGENDAGAGEDGMKKTYQNIKHLSSNIFCVMPPEGIKDLRQWVDSGLTQETLFVYIGEHGTEGGIFDPNTFDDDVAYNIARRFINEHYTIDNVQTLRWHKGQRFEWKDGCYTPASHEVVRGSIYRFLDGKRYLRTNTKGDIVIEPYKPTRAKVSDIEDAFNFISPVTEDPPVWLDEGIENRPRQVIAFRNGLLDVDRYLKGDIVLHGPSPNYFILATMPYDYDPKVSSQLYTDVINVLFNADEGSIRLLNQWFGYNLVPDNHFEKLMLFTGSPRSGKGTILEAIAATLGRNQYCSTTFQSMIKTFGLYSMHGKLATMLGDAKTPRVSEAGAALELILRIVGNDPVEMNAKYIPQFTTKLFCRFTVAMNELPSFSDHASALRARLNLLHFPNCYVGKEDFNLKHSLTKEAGEGKLINHALAGLKDLYECGKFIVPAKSQNHIEAFTEITNPVLAFLRETCHVGGDAADQCESKDQAFDLWCGWCSANNRKPGHKQTFCQRVQNSGMGIDSTRCRLEDSRGQAFKGIKFRAFAKVKYLED